MGKQYNYLGVPMHAPFALARRACEFPGITSFLREACLSALAALQIPGGGDNNRFLCSELVPESYRVAGLPITRAQPAWVSPDDLLHMREGDVSSLPVEQPLLYVGHLKFAAVGWELPGLSLPLPNLLPAGGGARP